MARNISQKAGASATRIIAEAAAPGVREVAAARLAAAPDTDSTANTNAKMLHELHVHQIELEMQNETLRQSRIALEESRDRYTRLFDFAPAGYVTLGGNDLIVEANFAAAALLGTERSRLISRQFTDFVTVGDRDRWRRLSHDVIAKPQAQAGDLLLLRSDGDSFPASIDCRYAAMDGNGGELLVTMTDISERRRFELMLSRSEEAFRRLAQISPIAIFRADPQGRCTYANQRCAEIAGYPLEDLLGEGWLCTMHPDDREQMLFEWRRDMSARQPKPQQWRLMGADGSVRLVLSESAAELDPAGKVCGYITTIADITELREKEERRRTELSAQRDTLVREVHHRIKNNLQSVAGLLQRELGKFVELNPRLETAISQVSAIAIVHGLQSANPDEAIRLCDSVRNICKTVSDLSQRPVLFHVEHEQSTFRPVQIESSEAVAVALVLNELVLNAVKHSPVGGGAPAVSINADGASAQLLIRNALTRAPDFNIDTGRGLGTGLSLVRSLLPDQGVELAYELDTEGFMLTRLKLTAPVVARQDRPR